MRRLERYLSFSHLHLGAAATILEGGEVDLGGDADEDLPAWMIFTIVFGFVIFPLGMVLANYYFSRRCPKCRKLTLKQQSQQVFTWFRRDPEIRWFRPDDDAAMINYIDFGKS